MVKFTKLDFKNLKIPIMDLFFTPDDDWWTGPRAAGIKVDAKARWFGRR
jgi:hypothetical protein